MLKIDLLNVFRSSQTLALLMVDTLYCLFLFYISLCFEDARMTCETSLYYAFFIRVHISLHLIALSIYFCEYIQLKDDSRWVFWQL